MANFLNLVTENKSEICSNLFLVVLLICRISLWLLVQKLFLLKGSILWGAAQAVNVLHQCPVEYLHNGARILWSRIHMYRLNLLTSFVLFWLWARLAVLQTAFFSSAICQFSLSFLNFHYFHKLSFQFRNRL